jgi:hypothetical protein
MLSKDMPRFTLFALPLLASIACGGGSTEAPRDVADSGTSGDADDDSIAPGDTDSPFGTPSDTYPAVTPDLPRVVPGIGKVEKNLEIVTITFSSDTTSPAEVEAFADGLGASDYWKATTAEYGVGPTTSVAANHVHLTEAPPASFSASSTPFGTEDLTPFFVRA